jgi:hypothetical protein
MIEPQSENTEKPKEATSFRSSSAYGGFIFASILGGLILFIYFLGLSPTEFHNTSKIKLVLIPIGFGCIGAIFGEKFIERLAEWLKWF